MFDDQLTGIAVYREVETGSFGDDDLATSKTETLVFEGFRQIDPIGGGQGNIINEYQTQTAQNYMVYFELTDDIRKSDVVKFNGSNINQGIKYTRSTTDDTVLRITNFVDGSGTVGLREANCIAF